MQDFQQRVVDEKAALDDKTSRLKPFLGSDKYRALPQAEQERMKRQLSLMEGYSSVLGERIAAF
jgi:hypothetical protein